MTDDIIDAVSKALRRAWQLGQTFWQQADSESWTQQAKSDGTQKKFEALVDETRALLSASKPAAPVADECRAHLWALVDIWDDQDNEPDARCYVEGAFRQQLDDARTFLAASPAAPAQSGEPAAYLYERQESSEFEQALYVTLLPPDNPEETREYGFTVTPLYAAPQPFQPAQSANDDVRERIARALHYPACWDTAVYPTLESAAWEAIACAKLGCSTCETAPSAVVLDAERSAFEAWMRGCEGYPYAGQYANLMWKAWQARAASPQATATQPAQTAQSGIDALFARVTDWMNAHRISFDPQNELFRILAASLQPVAQTERALTDWQHRCAALVDIYDDATNNAPEDRCYVDGAFKAELDEVRALLTAAQPATGADHAD
jgi:hypothetical protein